jgi:hypothetical protein
MEMSIDKLPPDSVWLRPTFEYKRPVIVLQPSQKRFLYQQGEDFHEVQPGRDIGLTTLAKQAYPGADAILSFSRVVFNTAHTQALAQVQAGDDPGVGSGEILALHKAGDAWRVVRRHVEVGKTSGERVGTKCVPTDAPATVPTVAQLEGLVGDADITTNPTSEGTRHFAATSRYRFTPIKSRARVPGEAYRMATVEFLDSTGKGKKPIGLLDINGSSAQVTFVYEPKPDTSKGITLDGWSRTTEQFTILRVTGREFFGIWSSHDDRFMPWVGYFCGRLLDGAARLK